MVDKKNSFNISGLRDKVKVVTDCEPDAFDFSPSKCSYPPKRTTTQETDGYLWKAVSASENAITPTPSYQQTPHTSPKFFIIPDASKVNENLEFAGKDLTDGKYIKAELQGANFSAANLTKVDFSGANLQGADLSGTDLTDANLTGADLTGAVLSGSNLLRTNFTGAKLHRVILTEANLEDAILLDIDVDDLTIEELQTLVEYMAKYYPHKLNLSKMNLTLLDLSKIDLTRVSLRGVNFTGCSMKGVKIWELDLSECIISPEQIAEALGRVPTAQEMAKLLAPKAPKKKGKDGLDFTEFFYGSGKEFGVWDVTHEKGLDIGKLVESGMKLFRKSAPKPPIKDEEIMAHIKDEKLRNDSDKSHNAEMKEIIRQRKKEELQKRLAMQNEFENEISKDKTEKVLVLEEPKRTIDPTVRERVVNMRDRSRD